MSKHRSLIHEDRGDMLIENMVGITIVAAALLFALTTFNIMSISTATAAKNQAAVTALNNELETRLATGNHPSPGQQETITVNGTQGSISAEALQAGQPTPITTIALSIPVPGTATGQCVAHNTHPDCLTISGSRLQDLGAQVIELKAAANQSSDQYTVEVPTGTTTIYYAVNLQGNAKLERIKATSYKGSAVIAAASKAGSTGWNNGRITLDPSKEATTIGFQHTNATTPLNANNIIAIAPGE